jgi:hypothetical protein
LCSIEGTTARGNRVFDVGSFWVQAHSGAAVPVTTPLRFPWRLSRLVMHMSSPVVHTSTETTVGVPRAVTAIRGALVAAAIVVALLVAYTTGRPRVEGLDIPSQVPAGTTATIAYWTSGLGSAGYEVTPDRGATLSGTLPMGRHNLKIATSTIPQRYRVLLRVWGPLGSQTQTADIRTVAPQNTNTLSP